jgi:phage-related minor tail protein
MQPENTSSKQYWYAVYEGYESRLQKRLHDDLGIDQTAAETILRLRRQIVELQSRVRQLESELDARVASQQSRLVRYTETCYEATWIELEIQD